MLLNQLVQSVRNMEKDRIRAAMAMVEGANSMEVGSAQKKREYKRIKKDRE